MRISKTGRASDKTVVLYPVRVKVPEHERAVHHNLAERLARLQAMAFGGNFDSAARYGGPLYYVPDDSVVGEPLACELGIVDEGDLFGAVVPHAIVATKAITHPLLRRGEQTPHGWSEAFARRVRTAALRGYTVFTLSDAQAAGETLLGYGPVRVKTVRATAGRGQWAARDAHALQEVLLGLDVSEIAAFGLVLEEHLENVVTHSVGSVRLRKLTISYVGTQQLADDNHGAKVYGGTELTAWRGGFHSGHGVEISAAAANAIEQARVYDAAASVCFPGFMASRRNYDIVQGIDGQGRPRCGVLEQSWRIGGASSAEVEALEALDGDADRSSVRAACVEAYGESFMVPAHARVLFRGDDAEVGFITKFSTVEVR